MYPYYYKGYTIKYDKGYYNIIDDNNNIIANVDNIEDAKYHIDNECINNITDDT